MIKQGLEERWLEYKARIVARMQLSEARDFSNEEILRCLNECVLGGFLGKLVRAARDSKIDIFAEPNPEVHLEYNEMRRKNELSKAAYDAQNLTDWSSRHNPECMSWRVTLALNNPPARDYPVLNPAVKPPNLNPRGFRGHPNYNPET